jgi:hypothetical protein
VEFPYPLRGEGKVVKVKNVLAVPVKLVKVNEYTLATLQPNEEAEVTVDPKTIRIELKTP